jgi:dihydrodipicolinate synthase/N-acetylneuraminate lyase
MPGSDMIGSFASIWSALEAGAASAAWQTFTRILPLIRFELQPGLGVSAMKHNLKSAGVIQSSYVRHPTGSLDQTGIEELDFLRGICT